MPEFMICHSFVVVVVCYKDSTRTIRKKLGFINVGHPKATETNNFAAAKLYT